ncbi:ParA family protein [Sulfurimonas sp. HSL1-2]|uniref:ParA family protein n=1 Tax=Thiomicrolovo zhangzhouensis TaxID=3131933 RepID=UPI0031F7E7D3
MILTLSHQKGGVGKSTIAWNLALEFSKFLPVTVIDLDMQRSMSAANRIRTDKGMAPLDICHFGDADEFVHYIEKDHEGRLTIIDSGGFDSSFNRIAIMASDVLLTPVSDKPFDLLGLQKYEEILEALSGFQEKTIKTHVVLNNLNPALRNFGDVMEFVLMSEYFELMTSVLRQRVDFSNSVGVGKSVIEHAPQGRAALEMKALCKEIGEILNIL